MSRIIVIPESGLDDDTKRVLKERFEAGEACRWCGGLHDRECPRLKHIIYHPTDERQIREVEFWALGEWDGSGIIWPEDVYE